MSAAKAPAAAERTNEADTPEMLRTLLEQWGSIVSLAASAAETPALRCHDR